MILYLSVDIMAACNMISTNREASSLENSIEHCIPRTTGIHKKEYSPEPARHMEKYPLRFQISSIKRYLYRAQKGISRMISAAKKALLVTTVSGFVPQFEMNNVRILQNMALKSTMPPTTIRRPTEMTTTAWMEPVSYVIRSTLSEALSKPPI